MKKILLLLLALCMTVSLCACVSGDVTESNPASDAETSKTESKEESKEASKEESAPATLPVFTVTVVDGDGNPVSGAMVQVCNEGTCIPAISNAEGKAVLNVEIGSGYTLKVPSCPEGYEYKGEEEVTLESGITEYTVELSKVVSE